MTLIEAFICLPIGMIFGTYWCSISIYPLLYGIPRALHYVMKGVMSPKAPLMFFVPVIFGNLAIMALFFIVALFLPGLFSFTKESWGLHFGTFLGLVFGILGFVTNKKDLNDDFWSFCRKYKKGVLVIEKYSTGE